MRERLFAKVVMCCNLFDEIKNNCKKRLCAPDDVSYVKRDK